MQPLIGAIALLFVLNAQACREQKDAGQTPVSENTGGNVTGKVVTPPDEELIRMPQITDRRWYILTMHGDEMALPEGGERPWMEFSDGHVQGFTGCNNLMGSVTIENDRILFSEIGSTKKYCPELQQLERSILDMMAEVNTYSIEDGALTLWQGTRELASLRTLE
jgi:heat shock protein HslJ